MSGFKGYSEEEVDGREEWGHNTTIQHNNDKTMSTKHTNKIIEYTKNTQTPPWAH